jgi:hypothetical protein
MVARLEVTEKARQDEDTALTCKGVRLGSRYPSVPDLAGVLLQYRRFAANGSQVIDQDVAITTTRCDDIYDAEDES